MEVDSGGESATPNSDLLQNCSLSNSFAIGELATSKENMYWAKKSAKHVPYSPTQAEDRMVTPPQETCTPEPPKGGSGAFREGVGMRYASPMFVPITPRTHVEESRKETQTAVDMIPGLGSNPSTPGRAGADPATLAATPGARAAVRPCQAKPPLVPLVIPAELWDAEELLRVLEAELPSPEPLAQFLTNLSLCAQGKVKFERFLQSSLDLLAPHGAAVRALEGFFAGDLLRANGLFFPFISNAPEKDIKLAGHFCTLYAHLCAPRPRDTRVRLFQQFFSAFALEALTAPALSSLFLWARDGFKADRHEAARAGPVAISARQFRAQMDLCMLATICFGDNPILLIDLQAFLHPDVVAKARARLRWPNSWPMGSVSLEELQRLMDDNVVREIADMRAEARNIAADIALFQRLLRNCAAQESALQELRGRVDLFEHLREQALSAAAAQVRSSRRGASAISPRYDALEKMANAPLDSTEDIQYFQLLFREGAAAPRAGAKELPSPVHDPCTCAAPEAAAARTDRARRQERSPSGRLARALSKERKPRPQRSCRAHVETSSTNIEDESEFSSADGVCDAAFDAPQFLRALPQRSRRDSRGGTPAKKSPSPHVLQNAGATRERTPRDPRLIRADDAGHPRRYPLLPPFSLWKRCNVSQLLANAKRLDQAAFVKSLRGSGGKRPPSNAVARFLQAWQSRAGGVKALRRSAELFGRFLDVLTADAPPARFLQNRLDFIRVLFLAVHIARQGAEAEAPADLSAFVGRSLAAAHSALWHCAHAAERARTGVFAQAKPPRIWSWELPRANCPDVKNWQPFDVSYFKNPRPKRRAPFAPTEQLPAPVYVLNRGHYLTTSSGSEGGNAVNFPAQAFEGNNEPCSTTPPPEDLDLVKMLPMSPFHYSRRQLERPPWMRDLPEDNCVELEENMLWVDIEIERLRRIICALRAWMCAYMPNLLDSFDAAEEDADTKSDAAGARAHSASRKRGTRSSERLRKESAFLDSLQTDKANSPFFAHAGTNPKPSHLALKRRAAVAPAPSDEGPSGPPPPELSPLLAFHLTTVYGEDGETIVKLLKTYPFVAVPIVLQRVIPLCAEAERARAALAATTWRKQAYKNWNSALAAEKAAISLDETIHSVESVVARFEARSVECHTMRDQMLSLAKEKGEPIPVHPFPIRLVLPDFALPQELQKTLPRSLTHLPADARDDPALAPPAAVLEPSGAIWTIGRVTAACLRRLFERGCAAQDAVPFLLLAAALEVRTPRGPRSAVALATSVEANAPAIMAGMREQTKRAGAKRLFRHCTAYPTPVPDVLPSLRTLIATGHHTRSLRTVSLHKHIWDSLLFPLLGSTRKTEPKLCAQSLHEGRRISRIVTKDLTLVVYFSWLVAERLALAQQLLRRSPRAHGVVRPSMGSQDSGRHVPPRPHFFPRAEFDRVVSAASATGHPAGKVSCREPTPDTPGRTPPCVEELRCALSDYEHEAVPPNVIPARKVTPDGAWDTIMALLSDEIMGFGSASQFREGIRALLGTHASVLFSVPAFLRQLWAVLDSVAEGFLAVADAVDEGLRGGPTELAAQLGKALADEDDGVTAFVTALLCLQHASGPGTALGEIPFVPPAALAAAPFASGPALYYVESLDARVLFISKVRGATK
eukprot:gnl/Chilomastix_cuspidata/3240.p1 GENE.gnl/Chilomastix_cuspidata/3240~~gnl/Chilomastix_cuspidata/3240.p1  ORF type:complete len:1638 (+),score=455.22 gnl/Chilomastix_cuspidata/3240:968-5881(+)